MSFVVTTFVEALTAAGRSVAVTADSTDFLQLRLCRQLMVAATATVGTAADGLLLTVDGGSDAR